MSKFNKILLFANVVIVIVIVMVVVANAWTNPTANPPGGGGALYYYNANVGIGTTAPSALLHLKGQNVLARGQLTIEATDYTQITMYNGASTQLNSWYHNIASNTTFFGTSNAGGQLQFITAANANAVRIDASGNVGIGTTGPLINLQVGTSVGFGALNDASGDLVGKTGLVFPAGTVGFNYSGAAIVVVNSTGASTYGADLLFGTKATGGNAIAERMRITQGGNVGIGTTTPGYKLDVQGGDINTSGVYLKGGTAGISGTFRVERCDTCQMCELIISGGIITSWNCWVIGCDDCR